MIKTLAISCLLIRQSHSFTTQIHLQSLQINNAVHRQWSIHECTVKNIRATNTRKLVVPCSLNSSTSTQISAVTSFENDETMENFSSSQSKDSSTGINSSGLKDHKRKMKKESNRFKVTMAISSLLTAYFTLIYISGPGHWRYYVAGGICAAASHTITTPIDVIKVSYNLYIMLMYRKQCLL